MRCTWNTQTILPSQFFICFEGRQTTGNADAPVTIKTNDEQNTTSAHWTQVATANNFVNDSPKLTKSND